MFCPSPSCQNPPQRLQISMRQEVEIDYCPQCRGVWLDRGELDKLLAREAQSETQHYSPSASRDADFSDRRSPSHGGYQEAQTYRRDHDDDQRYREHDHRYREHDPRYPRHRRKSLLGELFDFD